jgi:hypothetical protein
VRQKPYQSLGSIILRAKKLSVRLIGRKFLMIGRKNMKKGRRRKIFDHD